MPPNPLPFLIVPTEAKPSGECLFPPTPAPSGDSLSFEQTFQNLEQAPAPPENSTSAVSGESAAPSQEPICLSLPPQFAIVERGNLEQARAAALQTQALLLAAVAGVKDEIDSALDQAESTEGSCLPKPIPTETAEKPEAVISFLPPEFLAMTVAFQPCPPVEVDQGESHEQADDRIPEDTGRKSLASAKALAFPFLVAPPPSPGGGDFEPTWSVPNPPLSGDDNSEPAISATPLNLGVPTVETTIALPVTIAESGSTTPARPAMGRETANPFVSEHNTSDLAVLPLLPQFPTHPAQSTPADSIVTLDQATAAARSVSAERPVIVAQPIAAPPPDNIVSLANVALPPLPALRVLPPAEPIESISGPSGLADTIVPFESAETSVPWEGEMTDETLVGHPGLRRLNRSGAVTDLRRAVQDAGTVGHGMHGAKGSVTMLNAEQSGQGSRGELQSLPTRTWEGTPSAEPAALGVAPIPGPRPEGARPVSPISETRSEISFSPHPADRSTPEVEQGSSTAPLAVSAHDIQLDISRAVVELKRLRTDVLSVVLRPDAHTELKLQLQVHADGINIDAQCHRGDLEHLHSQWAQLQQSLAPQGIRLGPLLDTSAGPTTFSGGNGSFQQQAERRPVPDDFSRPWPKPGPTSTTPGKTESAPQITPRILESWA